MVSRGSKPIIQVNEQHTIYPFYASHTTCLNPFLIPIHWYGLICNADFIILPLIKIFKFEWLRQIQYGTVLCFLSNLICKRCAQSTWITDYILFSKTFPRKPGTEFYNMTSYSSKRSCNHNWCIYILVRVFKKTQAMLPTFSYFNKVLCIRGMWVG